MSTADREPVRAIDLDDFRAARSASEPPADLTDAQRVLWFDRVGDWDIAHDIAQNMPDPDGAWLHAYLHRREGDLPNAGYWYRRARRPVVSGSLDDEWESLVRHFVARG